MTVYPHTMRAAVITHYGSPQELQIVNVPVPAPNDNQLLVKVKATAINDWDWCLLNGSPFYMRLIGGLFNPKIKIMGVDLAGEVIAIGKNISHFKIGDAVYGDLSASGFGAFAEYVCVPEASLTSMPDGMSFVDAAAIPHSALLALQSLRDIGNIKPGQKILVNGAGGGVGTLAVQITKRFGASYVTGVDAANKHSVMLQAGFDNVIDYQTQDFTKISEQYDLILDTKTNRSIFRYLNTLKPGGIYITVGGHIFRILQTLLMSAFIKWIYKKQVKVLSLQPNKGLCEINYLWQQQPFNIFIEGPYPLDKIKDAMQIFGEANHRGKVVIIMDNE